MRVHRATMAVCVLIGALAASGKVGAQQRDHAASPSATTTPRPATDQQAALRQANNPQQTAAAAIRQPGRPQASSAGISCVPYARAVTGMRITGNGVNWWGNAAGLYDRGQRPEPGAVMAFRASGNMSRGHVAVVRQVLGPREVLIDHANWSGPGIRPGSVMRNVRVIDVSDRNDWTAVRVQSGHNSAAFGRTYPIFGFIYNRPEDSLNSGTAYASMPDRSTVQYEQVAEMPDVLAASLSGTAASRRR
jgi:surface antigen